MTFLPLHDRILVRRLKVDEKTAGGITIPDTAKEKPQEGQVLAAGPGARDESGLWQSLDVNVKEADVLGGIEVETPVERAA